jgi:hypothetical protein
MEPRRRTGAAILAVVVLVVVATTIGVVAARTSSPPTTTTTTTMPAPTTTTNPYVSLANAAVKQAVADVNVSLPSTAGAPAPVLPDHAFTRRLGSKVVVGFVPYYELSNIYGESLQGFTYLVYSAIDVSGHATLVKDRSVNGWNDLQNGGAGDLVAAGHADGDRVLLSLFAEDESVIGPLCRGGATAGAKLAAEVEPLLRTYGFDGVDLDIEGTDTGDRAGYVEFVKGFSESLRANSSSWSLMLNTYPQSAMDPTDFFDVKALAPYVDELFVMGYDMDDSQVASAGAPLTGWDPDDAMALAGYVYAGLGSKTVLGLPFYGYDFPVVGSQPGAATTGTAVAVTYSAVVTSIQVNKHVPVWDPATETPYTVFRRDRQWHQTWFEDPTSIALKVALASAFNIGGVGAWELGMVPGQPQMLTVLDAGSSPTKLPLVG